MTKKSERYFEAFVEMGSFACDAAALLREILGEFDPEQLDENIKKMHAIEHDCDVTRHTMVRKLAKEFLTPFDREDILEMSVLIDTVTDRIEDVLLRLYMFDIKEIREDALVVADVIVKCTGATKDALEEFHNFRKSKTIQDRVIDINRFEDEGDKLYVVSVRNVFTDQSLSPQVSMAWAQVFHYMEEVCDACEDVAEIIEGVIMKNT